MPKLTQKSILKELKGIYDAYNVGDDVSTEHIQIIIKYFYPYINIYKKRPGKTVDINIILSDYNTPTWEYINDKGEKTLAGRSSAVRYFVKQVLPKKNLLNELKEACRRDVSTQIAQFKMKSKFICQLCKKQCFKGQTETDHYPTSFITLFTDFMKDKRPQDIKTEALDILGIRLTIKDKKIRSQWQEYHKKNARLREICIPCHKIYSKQQRLKTLQ